MVTRPSGSQMMGGGKGIQFISSRFRHLLVAIKLVVIYTKANQSGSLYLQNTTGLPLLHIHGGENPSNSSVHFSPGTMKVPENGLTLKHLYQRHTHTNLWKYESH